MNKSSIESFIGFIVLLVAIFFGIFIYKNSSLSSQYHGEHYQLHAVFTNVEGLKVGDYIKIGGVNIGNIHHISVNPKNYNIEVQLSISNKVLLPDDTQAIISGSLFGDKFISLLPGASTQFLKRGDAILYTQPSISIENLIGRFIFDSTHH